MKIDEAIVTLMMLAVSSRGPMARTSCSSAVVGLANFVVRQIVLQDQHRENEIHLQPAVAREVDVERPQVPDVPVLHLLPHTNADVDAFRKPLVEAEELPLPIAKLPEPIRMKRSTRGRIGIATPSGWTDFILPREFRGLALV